jgi:cytochrome P450
VAIAETLALARSAPRLVAMAVLGATGPFARAVDRVDALLYERIDARGEDPRSVLASLREARAAPGDAPPHGDDGSAPGGEPLSRQEIRDHLVTLLAAGHETTATALAWAFERLGHHPAVVERLREGDAEYREAVAREVLRVRPVLTVAPRVLAAPFEVAGWTLPPGTAVSPCIYLTHRRSDVWDEPSRFRPERFLPGAPKPPAYGWIPFGGGTRRCAGAPFALMEMEAVLEEAARAGRLDAPGPAERVRRRAVTLSPARGGRVRVS